MRWNVYGTDEVTGGRVVLGVEGGDAAEAVRVAHGKGVVVSGVRRVGGVGGRMRRAGLWVACVGVVVLMGVSLGLWRVERNERGVIEAVMVERGRMAAALLADEETMKRMEAIGASRESLRELEVERARVAGLEGELVAAKAEAAGKRALEAALAAAEERGRVAEAERGRLARELAGREAETAAVMTKAATATEEARGKVAALGEANKELAGEVELLKGQLLAAAARPAEEGDAADGDGKAGRLAGRMRWSLRTSYDTASDFVAMHFAKESMQTLPVEEGGDNGGGMVAWTATSAGNAATVRVTHDRKKQRVYAATLSVSLAADGPKERVAENVVLAGAFCGRLRLR